MQDLIISLNGNILKVSYLKKGEFSSVVKDVPQDVAHDSRILDTDKFSEILAQAIKEISAGQKAKFKLNIVMEPEDAIYKFVTVNKTNNGQDLESKIISEVQTKLEGVTLDDLYFSYVKIAPFVYQFVGVRKEYLDKYLTVSDKVGLPLNSIMPWTLLLPKYVGSNASSIFVCGINANPIVILSELGGVFFVGSYSEDESSEALNKLVQELSIYKRAKPIDKVYAFNYTHLAPVDGLTVHNIEVPNSGTERTTGFEANLLVNYMLDLAPDTLESQANVLNLLPLPVVEKKPLALAKVAVPVSAILLAGLIFGGFMFLGKNRSADNNGQVLSDQKQDQTSESSPTVQATPTPAPKQLDRKDLVVRVENGSGVTGIAAKTKDILEGLGYKVISIDTANETRESSLFKFKNAKLDYKDLITADMKDKLPSTVVEDGISTDNEYDLLIVIGTTQKL